MIYIFRFFGVGNATNSLKGNSDFGKLFMVARIYGYILATVLLVMLIFLYRIKDNNKYGAKVNLDNLLNNLKKIRRKKIILFIIEINKIFLLKFFFYFIFFFYCLNNIKKFECISTIFLIIILTIVHTLLNASIERARGMHYSSMLNRSANNNISVKKNEYPIRLLLIIYNWTKGGKALYCIIACYMIFVSIVIPSIKCWSSTREKNKYYQKVSIIK